MSEEERPAADLSKSGPPKPQEMQQKAPPYAGKLGDEGDGKFLQQVKEDYIKRCEEVEKIECPVERAAAKKQLDEACTAHVCEEDCEEHPKEEVKKRDTVKVDPPKVDPPKVVAPTPVLTPPSN